MNAAVGLAAAALGWQFSRVTIEEARRSYAGPSVSTRQSIQGPYQADRQTDGQTGGHTDAQTEIDLANLWRLRLGGAQPAVFGSGLRPDDTRPLRETEALVFIGAVPNKMQVEVAGLFFLCVVQPVVFSFYAIFYLCTLCKRCIMGWHQTEARRHQYHQNKLNNWRSCRRRRLFCRRGKMEAITRSGWEGGVCRGAGPKQEVLSIEVVDLLRIWNCCQNSLERQTDRQIDRQGFFFSADQKTANFSICWSRLSTQTVYIHETRRINLFDSALLYLLAWERQWLFHSERCNPLGSSTNSHWREDFTQEIQVRRWICFSFFLLWNHFFTFLFRQVKVGFCTLYVFQFCYERLFFRFPTGAILF